MDLALANIFSEPKDNTKISVSNEVFQHDYAEGLIHQVIVSYMAAARAGTKSNLGRSDVRGGGKKPWRQKGTGRARAGTKNSPIWRGGGVTFAATPRSFEKKVNRKVYRKAMKSIISEHIRQGSLLVVDNLDIETRKTKDLLVLLNKASIDDALFITDNLSENFYYASRNIPKIWIIDFISISFVIKSL